MIEIVTGIPGQGKTLYATKRILEARKAGRRVVANFHSKKGIWDFALWDAMMKSHNALIVIDEAQMWFNSRAWSKQSVGDLGVFQMSRKNGLDLMLIVQHEGRLDVAIKELAAYHIKCRKVYGKYIVAKRYVWEEPKPLSREIFRIKPSLYGHYFTEECIGERDGTGYRFGSIGVEAEIVGGQIQPTHYRVADCMTCRIVRASDLDDALARSLSRTGPHDRLPSYAALIQDGRDYHEIAPARSYGREDQIDDTLLGNMATSLRQKLPASLK